MKYAARTDRTVSSGWKAWRIHMEARERVSNGEDVILLTIGDPEFATAAPIVEAAINSLHNGRTHYTPLLGELPLREAVANFQSRLSGQKIETQNVIIVPGAQCGLYAACMCILEAGDEVIVLDPTYTTYGYVIGSTGATTVKVSLRPENQFRVDPSEIAAAISTRTKAIILNTPHNPTGAMVSEEGMQEIGRLCIMHDLWFITDEVYGTVTYDRPHISASSFPEFGDRSIVISSLSKSHAMTGWRLGWTIGPEELIRHMGNLQAGMLFGLPPFVQDAALFALTDGLNEIERINHLFRTRRDAVCSTLDRANHLHCHWPDGGMYVMLDVRETGISSYEFAHRLLAKERVALLPGEGFSDRLNGFLRLSLTATDEHLAEACQRIVRFANEEMTEKEVAV